MKKKIIYNARKSFFKDGIKAVHMDDIASHMGISKKTLYKHFRGKEELAEEAVILFREEIRSGLSRIREETKDPLERFEKIVRFAGQKLSEAGPLFLSDLKRDMPETWKSIEDFRRHEIMAHMTEILTEGKALGLVRQDIDTSLATLFYFGAIQTIIQPDVLEEKGISPDEAFANIRNIFLKGIKTDTQEGCR